MRTVECFPDSMRVTGQLKLVMIFSSNFPILRTKAGCNSLVGLKIHEVSTFCPLEMRQGKGARAHFPQAAVSIEPG